MNKITAQITSFWGQSVATRLFPLCAFGALAIAACSSVDGSNEETQVARVATQSLRLGQTEAPNSRVAISAAIDNLESFVVLNDDPNSPSISEVIYRTPIDEIVQIFVDELRRPISAEATDAFVTFSNYTDNSVDVSIVEDGAAVQTLTVTLPRKAPKSDSLPTARTPVTGPTGQFLLEGAAFVVDTVGCAGQALSGVGATFQRVSSQACASVLVNAVDLVRKDPNQITERIVNELPVRPTCDNGDRSFANAQQCSRGVGDDLLAEVFAANPTLDSSVTGSPPLLPGQESGESGQESSSGGGSSSSGNGPASGGSSGSSTSSSSTSSSSSSSSGDFPGPVPPNIPNPPPVPPPPGQPEFI